MIQDAILTVGSIIFILALIPTIQGRDKPPLATSVTTAIVLLAFAGVYSSLNLWLSTLTTLGSSICWWILVYQKRQQSKG